MSIIEFVVKGTEFKLRPVDRAKSIEENIQGGVGENDMELLKQSMSQFPEELPVGTVLLTAARHLLSFKGFRRDREVGADWRDDPRGWVLFIGRENEVKVSPPEKVFVIIR